MKLPAGDRAFVDPAKVRDYLLSATHPVGRFKAAFFAALGYSEDNWEALRDALLVIARTEHADLGQPTDYGQKYEIRATFMGPSGRSAQVDTIWIILSGEDFPRLVTAYPGKRP